MITTLLSHQQVKVIVGRIKSWESNAIQEQLTQHRILGQQHRDTERLLYSCVYSLGVRSVVAEMCFT
jgi:uncharacterized membrane protein